MLSITYHRKLGLEARSESLALWLAQDKADPHESTLGLSWHWAKDTLGYKHRPMAYDAHGHMACVFVMAGSEKKMNVSFY